MKYIFISILFFSVSGLANPETEKTAAFRPYEANAEVTPYLQMANFSFYAGAPDIHGKAYVPNFSTLAGLKLSWAEYGIATGLSLPIPKEEIDRRGKSDQFNLILSKYWRSSAIDLYYQKYRGFYAGNPASEFNLSKPERFTQFPDAYSINYGLNYYYAFSEDEYSFSSAFAHTEEQLISGGSPLVQAFYNHVEISLGKKILPGSEPADVQFLPSLQDVALETMGAGFGYGYTFVIEEWMATAQALFGLGVQSKSETATSNIFKSVYTPALKGNLNFSLAYKLKNGAIGTVFLMDTLFSNANDEQIYSTFMVGTLFFQFRI